MRNITINKENKGFKAIEGILRRLERRPSNDLPDEVELTSSKEWHLGDDNEPWTDKWYNIDPDDPQWGDKC